MSEDGCLVILMGIGLMRGLSAGVGVGCHVDGRRGEGLPPHGEAGYPGVRELWLLPVSRLPSEPEIYAIYNFCINNLFSVQGTNKMEIYLKGDKLYV